MINSIYSPRALLFLSFLAHGEDTISPGGIQGVKILNFLPKGKYFGVPLLRVLIIFNRERFAEKS
ncbi:MAG: hypothetical protein DRG50_05015 [Deltaproteobacteria bacterium]|nr:MAG: hypothetical protein DRG50_05015 [Deltaproteobacteria bacterium]